MAGGPSSPIGSVAMFGVGGSRGEGSTSPITSPMLPIEHTNKDAVRGEEWSDVGSDEEKKGGRMYWSEEDNLRLISSWINNSNDPIDSNSKSGPHYWKQVADEYNMHAPKDISNTYVSWRSDQQLMEMVHEEYKRVKQTDKPFPFEYWWRVVKDEPKWLNRDVTAVIRNKRNKVSESGAYTSSSNQDTEVAEETEHHENVVQFNNLQARTQEAIDNMAAAAREHAQAIAATDKEKLKMEKIKQYKELLMIDTSSFNEAQKKNAMKI
ncbi:hypothetical protein PVAP13_2KG045700, partial [Panicum virgatum]